MILGLDGFNIIKKQPTANNISKKTETTAESEEAACSVKQRDGVEAKITVAFLNTVVCLILN